MSLHEISGGRDSNREPNDSRRSDANTASQSGGDGDQEADGHHSPSNGGPSQEVPAEAAQDESDTGEQVTAIAVSDRESERIDTEHVTASAVLSETVVSVYTLAVERSSPTPDREVIGMQSQMGRSSTERSSSHYCGAASDLVRLRSSTGDGNADDTGHDPACAQPSGYLAARQ